MHIERKECIICNEKLYSAYFKNDYKTFVAHYAIETPILTAQEIPFNVCICQNCNTAQLKYLGDMNEIYKINHADSTGKTMKDLHNETKNVILKNKENIKNILEIGSSVGYLADLILENLDTKYYIIEPDYKGTQNINKIIINDFYENIDDSKIEANTIIISHVFEHFYNPIEILKKISDNKNIEYFYLVWPNLEYYVSNNILHVLNTEHTYYIDNTFLVKLFETYDFKLVDCNEYKGHSLIFSFIKETQNKNKMIDFKNNFTTLDTYYNKIFKTVNKWNEIIEKNSDKEIFVWPASIHCLYLLQFGLSAKIKGFLDNSQNKINKIMYGYNIPIYDFQKILKLNSNNHIILINGGVFNKDIENDCKAATNIEFVFVD
jgi:hypothetical protein